ncbi:MAG: hypothetical protein ACYTXY_43880, partial [Nostoc sp.]
SEYVIERYQQIPPGGNWQDIEDKLTNYTDSLSLKYTHWNRAIAEYFLSNNSNEQEIYLTISPRSLAAAFAKVQVTPLSPKEAEQDFVDVVSSAYRHRVLSYSAGFSVLHGDDENGFPKYIAFLALCVLAAYRMHSDEEV